MSQDSAQVFEEHQKALANGPAPPGAFNNKMGFDEYAQHAQVAFRDEVGGVLVGYAGHVPRARDKVGGCPIGNTPGTPVSPNGAVGIDMETGVRVLPHGREKTFAQAFRPGNKDLAHYTSEARDPQNKTGTMRPKMFAQGTTPGYTGHVSRVKTHSLGSTTHSTPIPGSSVFVNKFGDEGLCMGPLTVKLRTNAKGHHAVSGAYKLATINGGGFADGDAAPFELLAAIDDAQGVMLVDFSPINGPKDFAGQWTGDGVLFPDGRKWGLYKPPTVWESGDFM
jgi:hypothetical protein